MFSTGSVLFAEFKANRPAPPNILGVKDCCWEACLLLAKKTFDMAYTEKDIDRYFNHLRKCQSDTSHVGNGTYNGPFAFTLTKSPEDSVTTSDMIKAAQKLMSQQSCPVEKYAWNLEYGENQDNPHIHGMYLTKTGGRIERKHFMRAWPIWDEKKAMGAGFRGGYHRPVRHNECYLDYIAKEGHIGETNIK